MSQRITLFAEVILPLPLPSTYTYRVPMEWNDIIKKGQRVAVGLGNKKIYSGIVYSVHKDVPKVSSVKYILSILDTEPIVSDISFKLWQWIADYYMSYLGDIMTAALPSALRLKSQTNILISPDFDGDITNLNENEAKILEVVSKKEAISINDIVVKTGLDSILSLLNSMVKKGIIVTEEELQSKYKPKIQEYISLAKEYQEEEKLKALFKKLESKKTYQKQYEAILVFLSIAKSKEAEIKKEDLTKLNNVSTSAIKTLIRDEIFVVKKCHQSRLADRNLAMIDKELILSEQQTKAYNTIIDNWVIY